MRGMGPGEYARPLWAAGCSGGRRDAAVGPGGRAGERSAGRAGAPRPCPGGADEDARGAEALDASRASDAISGEVLSRVLARRIAAVGLTPPTSVRDSPGRLTVTPVAGRSVADCVADLLVARAGEAGSTGVITADAGRDVVAAALAARGVAHGRLEADRGDDEDHLVQLVPATVAKGLELDRVIVAEPVGIWTQSRTSAPASVASTWSSPVRCQSPRSCTPDRSPSPCADGSDVRGRPSGERSSRHRCCPTSWPAGARPRRRGRRCRSRG